MDQNKHSQGALNIKNETRKKPNIPKTRDFLAFYEFTSRIYFKLFLDISFTYFIVFSIVVNVVNSKHSNFTEFQVSLKRQFKFQHFSRSSRTCTSLEYNTSIKCVSSGLSTDLLRKYIINRKI